MAISTLFDYFKSQGQALPSVAQRAQTYGLGNSYTGTADQNNQLLAKLQGGQANGQQIAPTVPNTSAGQMAPSVSPTPAPGASPAVPPQEDYLKQYLANLTPTSQENDVQSQLTDLQGATRQGVAGLEGRGLGVPLTLIRGQQAKLQQQGQLQQQTLQQKLANLQSQRKSAIDVSKNILDRADASAKTASDRAYEATKAANAPYTLSQGQQRFVGGQQVASVAPKATAIKTPTLGKTVKSGALSYTPQMAREDSQALEASRGSDGHVDPTIYQNLYKAWISNGGSQKEFLTTYPPKGYVNPANTWLPSYLMPTKAKSSSRES